MSWWWLVEGLVAAMLVVGTLRAAQAVVPAVSGVLSSAVGYALALAAVVALGVLLGVATSAVRSRRTEREWVGVVAAAGGHCERRGGVARAAALPAPARALGQAPPPLRVGCERVADPVRRAAR